MPWSVKCFYVCCKKAGAVYWENLFTDLLLSCIILRENEAGIVCFSDISHIVGGFSY